MSSHNSMNSGPSEATRTALAVQEAASLLESGYRWSGENAEHYKPRADGVDLAVEQGIMARMDPAPNHKHNLNTALDYYRFAYDAAPKGTEIHQQAQEAFRFKLTERAAFDGQIGRPAAPEVTVPDERETPVHAKVLPWKRPTVAAAPTALPATGS